MAGKPLNRWSLKYPCCIECETTEVPHKGHGLCETCFSRSRWHREKDHWNTERRLARRERYYKPMPPEALVAYNILYNAIKNGIIQKGVCEVCGSFDVEGHHDNYSKPLNVKWLCPMHHSWLHKGREEATLLETPNQVAERSG